MKLKRFIARRRLWIIAALSAGVFFLMGWLVSFQLPKVRSWVLVKIEETSRDHLPVMILPGSIDIRLMPLGASLSDVKIRPKDELKDILDPVEIKEVHVGISIWQLIQGRLRLRSVEIEGAKVSARIPPSKNKSGPPLKGLFDTLALVPVNLLRLENLELHLKLADPNLHIDIESIDLSAEKVRGALLLDLNASSAFMESPSTQAKVRLDLEANLLATRDRLALSDFKLRRGDSFVIASGELRGDTEALDFKEQSLKVRSELQLESMRNWAVKTFPAFTAAHPKFPKLKGRAFLEGKYKSLPGKKPDAEFTARTEGFQLDQFFFDRLSTGGSFKAGTLHLPEVTLDHPAGAATLTNLVAKIGEHETTLETKVKIPNLQIHELLKHIGVGEIPVWLQASGEFPCAGTVTPNFTLTCRGNMHGENLLVRGDMKAKGTIAALRDFKADGEFSVDAEKVTYATELTMPNSKGRSHGEIAYATGFKIDFEADALAFQDVTNLADLKLEGSAKIKGSTEGDSKAATFTMDLDGTEIWFEDFWLGNPKTRVGYKSKLLAFQNMQGTYTVSRYNADVSLDFGTMEIAVQGRLPFFDAKDLLKVFSRRVQLPFELNGTGQAQIKASGPLNLAHLTYDLKSSLFRGNVAGESFDQANFDVKSNKGEVTAERVQVTKGPAVIFLTGQGHPDGKINTVVHGRGIRLEDVAAVANSGLSLAGQVDFDMDMKGPVLAPDTDLRGTVTKTSVAEQAMPDSKMHLSFGSKTIEGEGLFLGEVVKAGFVIPLNKEAPFKLSAETKDWNFAPLFAAIAGPAGRKDHEGRLSAKLHLSSDSGGFWNSTGELDVSKFILARGPISLTAKEPLSLSMKNGRLHVKKFELSGGNDIFLKMIENHEAESKVDVQVSGKLDLGLLSLLTPFFEDLRGILTFAFNAHGGTDGVSLLGSAYIDKGFLKFFDFPHAFEDLQADLLFNQKKIIFNSIKTEFGGGRAVAQGGMELNGYKNFPVNVTATFDKVTLNVPDKVSTTGAGTLSFTGSWFPFLLKGEYNVREGLITKEFGGDSDEADGIRRSIFLPELLLKESFAPVLLDVKVNFEKGIAIKNEMLEGKVLGQLTVRGNPAKPSLSGTVTTDSDTKLNFKDTVFEVTSANVQFDDPNEINPRLFVTARSRVKDHDVSLQVQGTGKKPDFVLSSVPPLAEKEIISLLALGATDTDLDKNVSSQAQASQTGLQIGSGVLKNNPLSKIVKDATGFDVQLAPSFDDTNSAVQKIIVTRQFTPNLGVAGSRSIGKKSETEARVKYRLNDRLSVIGSWKGADYQDVSEPTVQSENSQNNNFGVDLEYKVEFK